MKKFLTFVLLLFRAMKIPLSSFEQHINETILKRGLAYYKKGHVGEVEPLGDGEFAAEVEGTEPYTVRLKLDNGVVVHHTCTCPYIDGPACKHLVAVLFAMQAEELGLKKSTPKASSGTSTKRTVKDQVTELLDKISHEELRQFVVEYAKQEKGFWLALTQNFIAQATPESPSKVRQQVKAILRSAKHRDFIHWRQVDDVSKAVVAILDTGSKYLEAQNYEAAFTIGTVVLEEMTDALQYCDDSSGNIGYCICSAMEIIGTISDKPLEEKFRKKAFLYCTDAFSKKIFEGWDWHFGMVDIAANLMSGADEVDELLRLVSVPQGGYFGKEFAEEATYNVLVKGGQPDEARRYLMAHIGNKIFREIALTEAYRAADYAEVEQLASDGITCDSKDKPGLVAMWKDWLAKALVAQGNAGSAIDIIREEFIGSGWERRENYRKLRNLVAPEKWTEFVDGLIADLRKASNVDVCTIADIYASEERLGDLIAWLKAYPQYGLVGSYEKKLAPLYPVDVAELYCQQVWSTLERASDRKKYQEACTIIRRIAKLGQHEMVAELVDRIRKTYPRRPSLMQELNLI